MKNAVLKTPSGEERTGLKRVKFCFLLFMAASVSASAQVNIGGFCKYESVKIDSGYSNFTQLNYNSDQLNDLLIFRNSRYAKLFRGEPDDEFLPIRKTNLGFEISAVKKYADNKDKNEKFIFISRKDKLAGILQINEGGYISVLKKTKLQYNPEFLDAADINNDGVLEAVISGGAYSGADILREEEAGFARFSILKNGLYASPLFTDLNNDQYTDIAAFSILDNSLIICYNNLLGSFAISKKIPLTEPIHSLRAADVDLDGRKDIIAAQNSSIIILYGDEDGNFSRRSVIGLQYPVKSFVVSDLNNDGISDFAYIDKSGKNLSIAFSEEGTSEYEELPYLMKSGLKELKLLASKTYKGIAAISSEGYIYIISELPVIKDNTNLVFSPRPSFITYADIDRNGIADFVYYDDALQSLHIIERNSAGIPFYHYSCRLLKKPERMLIDDSNPAKLNFLFYVNGDKLIQIVSFDSRTQKFEREDLYAQYPVADLRLRKVPGEKRSRIAAAYNEKGSAGLEVFTYKDFRYRSQISESYETGAYSVNLSGSSNGFSLLFWNVSGSNASFNEILFDSKLLTVKDIRRKFNIRFRKDFSVINYTDDMFNTSSDITASFIKQDINKFIVFSAAKFIGKIPAGGLAAGAYADNIEQLYFGEMDFSRLKYLFIYNPVRKYVGKLEPLNGGKNAIFQKVAETPNLFDYFIKNLNFKKFHLVYTDTLDNCIKIKELK